MGDKINLAERMELLEQRLTSPNSLTGLDGGRTTPGKTSPATIKTYFARSSSGNGLQQQQQQQHGNTVRQLQLDGDEPVSNNVSKGVGDRFRTDSTFDEDGKDDAGKQTRDLVADFVAEPLVAGGPHPGEAVLGVVGSGDDDARRRNGGTPSKRARTTSVPGPAAGPGGGPAEAAAVPSPVTPGSAGGGGAMVARRHMEAEEARLAQEWKKVELARAELTRSAGGLDARAEELAAREAALKAGQAAVQARHTDLLRELLLEKARGDRELARIKLRNQSQRLGQIGYERHGATFAEVWQDGWALQEVKRGLDQLAQQKERTEALKKKVQRRKAQAAKQQGAEFDARPFAEDEEHLKIRLAALRRDETVLTDQLDRLTAEKAVHLRELKRVSDESGSRFVQDNRLLHDKRYVLLSLLGRGGFSEVHHAFDVRELRPVACKIHQLNSAWNDAKKENYTKHACREFHIHKSLAHPRIVSLYDVFEIDQNSFCTVLEYSNGGDLDSYLKQRGSLPEKEARFIVRQILHGLAYLADQPRPVIHYDLKPANVLFDSDGNVKITDFGLSKVMDADEQSLELTSQGAGTYWYLPPECFDLSGSSAPKISSKVDMWSVGVIFYQMLFGRRPFGHDLSQSRILQDQVIRRATAVKFPSRPSASKNVKRLICQLLAYEPAERLGVREAVEHPYFSGPSVSTTQPAAAAASVPPPSIITSTVAPSSPPTPVTTLPI